VALQDCGDWQDMLESTRCLGWQRKHAMMPARHVLPCTLADRCSATRCVDDHTRGTIARQEPHLMKRIQRGILLLLTLALTQPQPSSRNSPQLHDLDRRRVHGQSPRRIRKWL
jgi:hypothetical protein